MLRSFHYDAGWTLLGQITFAATQWIIIALLGRIGGADVLGSYSLAMAIAGPFILLCGLQLRQILAADAQNKYLFSEVLWLGVTVSTVGLVTLAIVAALFYPGELTASMIMVLGVTKFIENISGIYYGKAQRFKRLDLIAQSIILRSVAGCVTFSLVYIWTGDALASLCTVAVSWFIVWVGFDRPVCRHLLAKKSIAPRHSRPSTLRGQRLKNLVFIGVPLGITVMLASMHAYLPRYFIEGLMDSSDLGLFAAMAHFVVAGRMFMNSVCQTASPRLADMYVEGDAVGIRRLLMRIVGVGLFCGCLLFILALLLGEEILHVIYGPEFSSHADLFPWIGCVAIASFAVAPLGYGLTSMQIFRVQPIVVFVSVSCGALACYFLVPEMGLKGAAMGWIVGLVCQIILFGSLCRQRILALKRGHIDVRA